MDLRYILYAGIAIKHSFSSFYCPFLQYTTMHQDAVAAVYYVVVACCMQIHVEKRLLWALQFPFVVQQLPLDTKVTLMLLLCLDRIFVIL